MDVLVAYDIRTGDRDGERTLARVAAICERCGTRVRYSVFECRLSGVTWEHLKGELLGALRSGDRISVYRFPSRLRDARTDLGEEPKRELDDPWIV